MLSISSAILPIRLIRCASGLSIAILLVADEAEGAEYGGAGDIELLSETNASFFGPKTRDLTFTYTAAMDVGEIVAMSIRRIDERTSSFHVSPASTTLRSGLSDS